MELNLDLKETFFLRSFLPTPSLISSRSRTFWLLVAKQYFESAESFEVTVTCPMDFSNYPFDHHKCRIMFGDAEFEIESLVKIY